MPSFGSEPELTKRLLAGGEAAALTHPVGGRGRVLAAKVRLSFVSSMTLAPSARTAVLLYKKRMTSRVVLGISAPPALKVSPSSA